jgi:hypothetical protein
MQKLLKARSVLVLGAMMTVLFFIAGQSNAVRAVTVSSELDGSLVKADMPDVYFVGTDGKRYVFPNEKVYFSWYTDFSSVKTITSAELAALPIGGNVTYRPGTRLVKIQTDPKVYAVSSGGALRWIETEAVAKALYGDNWAKQVDDVADTFFVNYKTSEPINTANDYSPTSEQHNATDISTDKEAGTANTNVESHPDTNTNSNVSSAYQFCPTGDNITDGCCTYGTATFTQSGLPITAGSLIKSVSSPMVYYYSSNGKRYVMTSQDVMASWYDTGADLLSGSSSVCRNVKQLSAADMSSITIGGNADIRPGTYIVKIASDPKLYVVSRGRTIRPLASSALAEQIFPGTSTQRIKIIPDAFFSGYHIGTTIISAADYNPTDEYNVTMESELGSY